MGKDLLKPLAHLHVADKAFPEGFQIRSLHGEAEVNDYVYLHRAVFQSKHMTAEWRLRILHRTVYQPDLDSVAGAPDGNLATSCIYWVSDSPLLNGQIDPLGVNKER